MLRACVVAAVAVLFVQIPAASFGQSVSNSRTEMRLERLERQAALGDAQTPPVVQRSGMAHVTATFRNVSSATLPLRCEVAISSMSAARVGPINQYQSKSISKMVKFSGIAGTCVIDITFDKYEMDPVFGFNVSLQLSTDPSVFLSNSPTLIGYNASWSQTVPVPKSNGLTTPVNFGTLVLKN